jgi:PAS domain S-box-containing protein
MNKFTRLSVGQQLLLTFGTLCAILLTIGGLFFFSLRSIDRSNRLHQERALQRLALIDDTAQDIGQMQAEALREVFASDAREAASLDQSIRELEKINFKELTDYRKLLDTTQEKQLYDKLMQARKFYWEQTQPVLALGLVNRDLEAKASINSMQAPAYDQCIKSFNDLIEDVESRANDSAEATTHFIASIRILGDALAGVAIFMVIGTGFSIARIERRLREDNVVLKTEVAERKKAEEALRLLSSAVEQAKESIVITDAELDLPGPKIIFVNPAFTKMTGYTAEEVIGKTPRILQGPHTDKTVLSRLRECLAQDEVFEGEAINYRKDGTKFTLEWQIVGLRNAGGKVTHFVAIQRDITERKRLEFRLYQSQKLETVGKLAGGVAHEFNSILTAIIGQSELLLNDLSTNDPLRKNAQEIYQAAERAATLTRQLLAYGRQQILQPEMIDLNAVLNRMLGTLQHLMGREVAVRIAAAPGLKTVKIDPGQIEQVIVNMAINAADAMPNGGQLILETANVTLDEEYVRPFAGLKPGNYVMLAVTDTGIGMSDEVKARAFEPFFSTKSVGQGTGLGLSTCYGIIKQSDGHIAVYSEPARGTTFKIYLPKTEQQTQTRRLSSLANSPDLPGGTETILLAEDDPSLLEMASSLLKRLGYTVLTAANGVDALNLKQQRNIGHIDLLLTDVVMPHMSGKELSDRILAIYPNTKILFTSAYTQSAIVHQGILNEGVTLLSKPFTPSALANKVREVLDRPS